jgi:Ca2+-binding RTX toxin-like protein
MALLTAKQDPAVVFDDLDTSQAAGDSAIASYQRLSSTQAVLTLQSLSGVPGVDNQDYILTIEGTSLPQSLTGFSLDLLNAKINKAKLARKGDPNTILFSWDSQGSPIKLTDLGAAVNSGNQDAVLNLFLGGTDTLLAEYENVDITPLDKLENVTLTGANVKLTGNAVANVLKGNALNNEIRCGSGDDEARGFDGNDSIYGDDGNDKLYGGKGDDRLFGALLNDIFFGEEGDDAMRGGNGRDTLTGGSGRDELQGDFGRNQFVDNKDSESDLLVIKADQTLVNPLFGNVDNSGGTRCDLIGKIDAIDKIIIQGVTTAKLTFQAGYSWTEPGTTTTYVGTAIFADLKLEALYTGGDLTLDQLKAITTGDASADVINNTKGFYGTW